MQAPKNIDNEEGVVTLKDFQPGNTAYRLCMHTGTNREPHIAEVTVVSVGRIYVTIGTKSWSEKYMDNNTTYLHEKANFGEAAMLFRTRADAENYIEKHDLALWLGCISVSKAEGYSLEQLRKVREILET